jgi:hypothetical protein
MDATSNLILMYNQERDFRRTLATERRFRDRNNPLDGLLDEEVKRDYHFYPETIYYLAERLSDRIININNRSNALTPLQQVLITLEFLCSGSFYRVIGKIGGVHKSTVCRVVHRVTDAICELSSSEIVFPSDKALDDIRQVFYRKSGIPKVVGCVDCTLVKIKKPGINTSDYICRKKHAAINVQVRFFRKLI